MTKELKSLVSDLGVRLLVLGIVFGISYGTSKLAVMLELGDKSPDTILGHVLGGFLLLILIVCVTLLALVIGHAIRGLLWGED